MSNGVIFPTENVETLSKEEWLRVAEGLLEVGPILQEALSRMVADIPDAREIHPALDPDTFEAYVRCACAAVCYVAEFCPGECHFILTKEE